MTDRDTMLLSMVTEISPNWASQVTAWAAVVAALGVLIAALQFVWQRKADRIAQTNRLVDDWQKCNPREIRLQLDCYVNDYEANRRAAIERYIQYMQGHDTSIAFESVIQDFANCAERIEIYIRDGVAEEGIVAETVGYWILAIYYIVHDILEARAKYENLDYEGWRDLAMRVRDYARLHPAKTRFPGVLLFTPIPKLEYMEGPTSPGYRRGFPGFRRLLALGFVGYIYDLGWRKKPELKQGNVSVLKDQMSALFNVKRE